MSKRRITSIIFVILTVVCSGVVYNIYLSFERASKTAVTLVTAPTDATVAFTNTATKKVTKGSHGTVYIEPGIYDILVEKKGFNSYKKNTRYIKKQYGYR